MHRALFLILAAGIGCGGWDFGHDKFGHVPTSSEPAVSLGAKNQLGYHVAANASIDVVMGDLGFVVVANGSQGWRINWTDTYGYAELFSGTVLTDGAFANITADSDMESITVSSDYKKVDFYSTPRSALNGFTFSASRDPIYFNGTVTLDRSPTDFNIYFTGSHTGKVYVSPYNPVAFASP